MAHEHPSHYVRLEEFTREIVTLLVHDQEDQPVLQFTLQEQKATEKAVIYVDCYDPLTRPDVFSHKSGHEASAIFSYAVYELLLMEAAKTDVAGQLRQVSPDIFLHPFVALKFDGAMRDMFYECGENPGHRGDQPHRQYYGYKR